MKKILGILFIFFIIFKANAQTEITSAQAKDYVDSTVTVTGTVAEVTLVKNIAHVNFEKKYPETEFSGVLFMNNFPDLVDLVKSMEGKKVSLTGKIELYKDKPQIKIESKDQIVIK